MRKYGKHTLYGWSWRILLGIALTPILVFLLCAALLYVPPVQKWAVDEAAKALSEETGMDVSVERVLLKFPLDLSMGGVLAVQDGDTVVAARELVVGLRAMPLFDLKAEVDGIHLYDARVNTRDMIEAAVVKGAIAELSLNSHSTDLERQLAVVNRATLRGADLTVLLADSVPEDTTESEPVAWRVDVRKLMLEDVKAAVRLAPAKDSVRASLHIGEAQTAAFLDLGRETYRVSGLSVADSRIAYDSPDWSELLTDVGLSVDTLIYKGTGEMRVGITELTAKEQSGLEIREASARLRIASPRAGQMSSSGLLMSVLKVKTAESEIAASFRMDMNAFDTSPRAGRFSARAKGKIGKGDIALLIGMGGEATRETQEMVNKTLSTQPATFEINADGNMRALDVSRIRVKLPGLAMIDGNATLWDLAGDLSLRASLKARDEMGGKADVDGTLDMATEAYEASIDFRNLAIGQYMQIDTLSTLTGSILAHGRGFDILSPSAALQAEADIAEGKFGKTDLSTIHTQASLDGSRMSVSATAHNSQIETSLAFDGELSKDKVAGTLNLRLPFADIQAMGFSEEVMMASVNGRMDFAYDMDRLFNVDSHIDGLRLRLSGDSVKTAAFRLKAEARTDTTRAELSAGDLRFSFFSPNNVFDLLPQVDTLGQEAMRRFADHNVNLNELKEFLPELSIRASAGTNNPVADVLNMYKIRFGDFAASLSTSRQHGVSGTGHIHAFSNDSVRVDTAYFTLNQDTTQLTYAIGAQCGKQPLMPAFKAAIEGYVKADEADAHLTYFDHRGKRGIDIGVRGQATDSCVTYRLYPERVVVGFRDFKLNEGNYVMTRPDRPVWADVSLTGMSDSCFVSLKANEDELGLQQARVVMNNLNLKDLMSVVPVPGLPSLEGLLHCDVSYADGADNFHVEGGMSAKAFRYDEMSVGDLSTKFAYMPVGETVHDIQATLAYNGTNVLRMDGNYDASGEGALKASVDFLDIPLSIASAFIPLQAAGCSGALGGNMKVAGPVDALLFNGDLITKDVRVFSKQYGFEFALENDTLVFTNSRVNFDAFKFYGPDRNPLTLNGYVDFSDFKEPLISLSLNGRNFKLIEAKKNSKSVVYGNMYGDFFARVVGSASDLSVRGMVRVLPTTDITYVMSETPLYQGDRLEDIVTFVDFSAPPPSTEEREQTTFMGLDVNMTLNVDDGAKLRGEFSADQQSYVQVQGGGAITLTQTPEGTFSLQGRYTINEGEMKYTLPVIPLKTFTIQNGSYIEFTGQPANPTLNVAATERVRATVGQSDGASRSVAFDVGLKISNPLDNMGLEFTIDAPEDMTVKNELAGMSAEEKNKLAVAMLVTGMYLSTANSKAFSAGNALNNFLQNEINNIAGRAMSTMVHVDVGMEQTTRDDGTTRTDYSFKFSRRFFSDRLNVVIGGKVSSDGDTQSNESGAYINDVSLEWRLDNGGTQYVRLFHEKDYSNLIEGELDKNGAGVLLRRKMDRLSDLFIWKKKEENSSRTRNDNTSTP